MSGLGRHNYRQPIALPRLVVDLDSKPLACRAKSWLSCRYAAYRIFDADKTIVAATDTLTPSSAMFLIPETWMVVYATCIQVSCPSFSYEKLGPSDISATNNNTASSCQPVKIKITVQA